MGHWLNIRLFEANLKKTLLEKEKPEAKRVEDEGEMEKLAGYHKEDEAGRVHVLSAGNHKEGGASREKVEPIHMETDRGKLAGNMEVAKSSSKSAGDHLDGERPTSTTFEQQGIPNTEEFRSHDPTASKQQTEQQSVEDEASSMIQSQATLQLIGPNTKQGSVMSRNVTTRMTMSDRKSPELSLDGNTAKFQLHKEKEHQDREEIHTYENMRRRGERKLYMEDTENDEPGIGPPESTYKENHANQKSALRKSLTVKMPDSTASLPSPDKKYFTQEAPIQVEAKPKTPVHRERTAPKPPVQRTVSAEGLREHQGSDHLCGAHRHTYQSVYDEALEAQGEARTDFDKEFRSHDPAASKQQTEQKSVEDEARSMMQSQATLQLAGSNTKQGSVMSRNVTTGMSMSDRKSELSLDGNTAKFLLQKEKEHQDREEIHTYENMRRRGERNLYMQDTENNESGPEPQETTDKENHANEKSFLRKSLTVKMPGSTASLPSPDKKYFTQEAPIQVEAKPKTPVHRERTAPKPPVQRTVSAEGLREHQGSDHLCGAHRHRYESVYDEALEAQGEAHTDFDKEFRSHDPAASKQQTEQKSVKDEARSMMQSQATLQLAGSNTKQGSLMSRNVTTGMSMSDRKSELSLDGNTAKFQLQKEKEHQDREEIHTYENMRRRGERNLYMEDTENNESGPEPQETTDKENHANEKSFLRKSLTVKMPGSTASLPSPDKKYFTQEAPIQVEAKPKTPVHRERTAPKPPVQRTMSAEGLREHQGSDHLRGAHRHTYESVCDEALEAQGEAHTDFDKEFRSHDPAASKQQTEQKSVEDEARSMMQSQATLQLTGSNTKQGSVMSRNVTTGMSMSDRKSELSLDGNTAKFQLQKEKEHQDREEIHTYENMRRRGERKLYR